MIFTDTVLTNELELLDHAASKKKLIYDNFLKISEHDDSIDTTKQKQFFIEYYTFAYNFTQKILLEDSSENKDSLKNMMRLQVLSKRTINYFENKKELSRESLVLSLEKISEKTANYFKVGLLLAVIGLLFMGVSIIMMHKMLRDRFSKIIASVKNLAEAEPDFSKRLEVQYNDEIGEITKWFNTLQSKLEIDYKQLEKLKQFTEQSLEKEIEDTQREVVFTMGSIGETRSKETGNHVRRVAEYSKLLALYSGLSMKEAELLKQASPMHDIGKVGIPDDILNKPGKHTFDEFEIMKTHAELGYDMLKHSNRPLLKIAAIVAHEHHEKWDGKGYPKGLKGENINIYGRITAVADVFDALGSTRVYKKAWEDDRIYKLFREESGKHFDPNLIDIFFDNLDDFLEIRNKFRDEN
jgi:response regulator RpfG family c-di-GMP phosphodiesterase